MDIDRPRIRRAISFLFFFIIFLIAAPASAYQQFEFVRELGEAGKKAPQRLLNEPRALALAGDRIYIADTEAHRVVVLDLSGQVIQNWGKKGDQAGQFKYPSGIAVDEQGSVYVVDGDNGRIQVFDGKGVFLRSFGSRGSGPKQFSDPGGISVVRGTVYVADAGNSRVQVLTPGGIFVGQIIVADKKDAMKLPVDVAVDAQGRIAVLDAGANKVRVFDGGGEQILVFGGSGKEAGGFDSPQGLAVDDRGNIYVADTGNLKIKKFDPQGKLLGSVGSEGPGPGQFKKPSGIKVDREAKILLLDRGKHTLQVFTSEKGEGTLLGPVSPQASVALSKEVPVEVAALAVDKRLWGISGDSVAALNVTDGRKIGTRGSEPGMLKNPRGIALDVSGNFWVADTGNDRLQKFNREGSLLQVIGRGGSKEGEFDSPSAVALTLKGNIIVADTGNRRVQVFSAKGLFLGAFGRSGNQKGQFAEPVALAVDGSENIYVVDRGNNRIARYDHSGTLQWEAGKKGKLDGEFDGPESIVLSADGEVYVLDGGNARVQVFDREGKFLRKFGNEGKGPGEFRSPTGLALEGGIRLYVGDRGNSRVQVFTLLLTPAVPTDLTAQPKMNEVQVNWKPNAESTLEHYKIYRADAANGEFKFLTATAEPFFVDRGLPSNRAYHYRVSSQAKEGNESAPSKTVSAVTPRLVPTAPKKVRIDAAEKQITISWIPNLEPFVDHYRVYRTRQLGAGYEQAGRIDRPLFVDGALPDEALYYYQVTAVGKEGDESPPSEVVFATTPRASLTAPPVEIARIEMREIFASAYKHYESHPLGKVVLRNNTDNPFPPAMLTFSIKDYMDFPTEIAVLEIGPKQEADLLIKPVFNNRILEVTENTPLQSEAALTFYIAGVARTLKRSFPVTLYERHAMTWDQKEKIGAFVTPKDPPVVDFARGVILPYVDAYPNLHSSLVYARTLYAALGVYGLSYIVDPTSPYQEFSGKAGAVDYLQYPRDTLARKSGDCDDLSILFLAALENIGIGTALVDVPGHVFIMFNTGVSETDKRTLGFPDSLLVIHRGTVWVPVEMTMVGAPFTRAWQKGAEEYRDWLAKGKVEIIEVQKAWEQFRPVTLPTTDQKPVRVKQEEIEAKFKDELETLGRQRLANLSAGYLTALQKTPNDGAALAQLGILYGENGMYPEALEQFQKLLAVDKENAMALNNIGNIHLLQERLDEARQAYEASLKAEPGDTGTMVNLARVHLRAGKKDEARKVFKDASALDPRVLRRYGDLASELGITK
jgi:DNA-binding beta-propeller fold protein YncE/tetratricopeptide (TPR) repeat protein